MKKVILTTILILSSRLYGMPSAFDNLLTDFSWALRACVTCSGQEAIDTRLDQRISIIRSSNFPKNYPQELESQIGNGLIERYKFRNLRKIMDIIRFRRDIPNERENIDSVVDRMATKAIQALLDFRNKQSKSITSYLTDWEHTEKEIKKTKKNRVILEKRHNAELKRLISYLSKSAKENLLNDNHSLEEIITKK